MSQYIDLLYDKPYVKKIQDSENGVIKFEFDVNKYLDFHYINNLSKVYKLDVPEFTLESLEAFKKNILDIEKCANYEIESNIEFICNEIEKYNNTYESLTNIIVLLKSINNPDIFNETITKQLYELLKLYRKLSNINNHQERRINGYTKVKSFTHVSK